MWNLRSGEAEGLVPGRADTPGFLPGPICQFLLLPCPGNTKYCPGAAQRPEQQVPHPLSPSILLSRTLLPPAPHFRTQPARRGVFFWGHTISCVLNLGGASVKRLGPQQKTSLSVSSVFFEFF